MSLFYWWYQVYGFAASCHEEVGIRRSWDRLGKGFSESDVLWHHSRGPTSWPQAGARATYLTIYSLLFAAARDKEPKKRALQLAAQQGDRKVQRERKASYPPSDLMIRSGTETARRLAGSPSSLSHTQHYATPHAFRHPPLLLLEDF